jgi:ankyrin repeat protein
MPQSAPLHWAAWVNVENVDGIQVRDPGPREELVALLLDRGADPNIVSGNGLTPLDIAEAAGPAAIGIVERLKRHGAKRAAEL